MNIGKRINNKLTSKSTNEKFLFFFVILLIPSVPAVAPLFSSSEICSCSNLSDVNLKVCVLRLEVEKCLVRLAQPRVTQRSYQLKDYPDQNLACGYVLEAGVLIVN